MDYLPRRLLEGAFRRLSRSAVLSRLHAVRALAEVRGIRYVSDSGQPRTIAIALKPWVLTSAQILHFHRAMRLLADALARLPRLHAAHPDLQAVMPFDARRRAWLQLAAAPRSRPLAVLGRLDSTAAYDHAGWRRDFRMLEPNAVGVGGVHYAPAACSVLMAVVGDILTQALPGRAITPTPDPRQLLIGELRAVAARLGRPLRGVALLENADFTTGTDEFSHLAGHLAALGLRAVVADPRDLRLGRRGLTARGVPVDLLYRDSELAEFIAMEKRGARLTALREAIQEGRLISGLTWEFDQKSAWEVFTDQRYARHFSPAQQRFFREHVLWTRLVREARVSDPAGRLVDLPAYVRRHRRQLVLKPNTLFGGEGVTIGPTVSQRTWEQVLHRALCACLPGRQGRERYVVQALARVHTDTLPLLLDGRARMASRATVSGFFFSSQGIGLIGRFSPQPVVNVSQGGGLVAALWAHDT